MDKLDFLDGQEPADNAAANETPAVTPETPEAALQASEGPARGPDGKFAPKAATEAQAPAEAAPQAPAITPEAGQQVQPEPAKVPDGYVPVAALQAMREELNQLKRQQQQPQAYQPQPGDEGYEDWVDQQSYEQQVAAKARADVSYRYAVKELGEERAGQVKTWAAQRFNVDPSFAQQSLSADDPFAFAVEEFQKHEAQAFAAEMFADPARREQFKAFMSGQAPAPATAAITVAPPAQPPAPPQSLAAAPNAGGARPGATPVGPHVAFDTVFKD